MNSNSNTLTLFNLSVHITSLTSTFANNSVMVKKPSCVTKDNQEGRAIPKSNKEKSWRTVKVRPQIIIKVHHRQAPACLLAN